MLTLQPGLTLSGRVVFHGEAPPEKDGKRSAMVFTDPPYNVRVDGHASGLGATRHREFSMASGEMTEAQYAQSMNYRQMLAEQIARGVRSNTLVAASAGPRYASNETVPIQPYIDQTHVRDPDISGSRRKSKTSKSKKTSAVHKKKSSDEGSESKPKKKKSTSKKSED